MSSSSSSEGAAPANIRVLVRVRPFNEREMKFNPTSVLEIDDVDMKSSIDFGMPTSSATHRNDDDDDGSSSNNNSGSSRGTISIVDNNTISGGYGSGYDSGANNTINASTSTASRSFTYDAVFGPQSKQVQIYDSVKGIIDAVCAGYNGTIVAYGQTGSGKTHTIFGEEGLQDDNTNAGLVQRSLKSIFHKIAEQSLISPTSAEQAGGGSTIRTTTKASFFEIYNEQVYDLLSPSNNDNDAEETKGLPVREDSTKGVYVEGLVEREVSNTMEALDVLRCGTDNRRVAATNMNRVSSRSHAMFVLTVKSELFAENGVSKVRMSKFSLVDLAGSERQKATDTAGERLKEASMINNSLLCLGQVINSLVDREKGKLNHVPFRDSKLTFLLRDSWGGNSKTCLVATVTPSFASLSETVSTLKFAQRAKLIKNTAVLNENTCGSVAALQAEIARLRTQLELKSMNSDGETLLDSKPRAGDSASDDVTLVALRNQNTKLNKKVKVLKDASNHREMQVKSMKRKLQQETLIRKCKERRITHLSSKGKTSGMEEEGSDELTSLREEVTALRQQLELQPTESVEWMLKYKEERARVEEMETDAKTTLVADEKNRMESSIVTLMNEKETLQQTVESMSNERNNEIDSIINDVTKLENANINLQSQLDEKEVVIKSNNDKIKSSESQLGALEEEMKITLECLESTQNELAAEKERTIKLQESVESMTTEVNQANAAVAEHKDKAAVAENELKKLSEQHNEATDTLNSKLSELQKDLDAAMSDNESLMKTLKDASDDLDVKKVELESLEQEKSEALKQLGLSQEKNNSDIEAFKMQEESLRAETKKLEESIESLLADKTEAASNLERITAENTSLSGEVEALKAERDALLERVETLDKLHDHVASLEDEVEHIGIEKDQMEDKLQFVQADLERTIRLEEHLSDTQAASYDDELTLCDEIINRLSTEQSNIQKEVAKVSQQLAENTALSVLLEADLNDARDTVQTLESQKAESAQELEKATAHGISLSEEMEVLKSEQEKSISVLNSKLSELQTDLDVAKEGKESLANDLEAKKTELVILEQEKSELEEDKEKSSAALKLQKDAMSSEILKAEEKIESLLAEKVEAATNLEEIKEKYTLLSQEVNALKAEVEVLDKLRSDLASLEDEIDHVNIEKVHLEEKLKFVEADLNRSIRLHEEKVAAQTVAHNNDLAERDETICSLTEEKSILQLELTKATQKLAESSVNSNEKVDMLQNEIAYIKEELSVMEHKEKNLRAELDTVNADYAKSSALVAEQEAELKTKLELNEAIQKELDETKTLLSETQATNEELNATQTAKVNDLTARVEAEVVAKAKLEQEKISIENERDELKETVESLTKEKKLSEEANVQALEDVSKEKASIESERDELKETVESLTKEKKLSEEANVQALEDVSKEKASIKSERDELKETVESLAKEKKLSEEANVQALEDVNKEKASIESERDELKAKLDALENENATLREQSTNNPPSSSTSSEPPSSWKPSPIKPAEEPRQDQDSSFDDAEDSFDEDMFLPNIEEQAKVNETLQQDDNATDDTLKTDDDKKSPSKHDDADAETPKSDDSSKSPSKTPFKQKREMFSPPPSSMKKIPASKKKTPAKRVTRRSKAASSSKNPQTPPRRLTRATRSQMRNSSARTPLGNNNAQTPLTSTRKVRTNWSGKANF